MRSLVGVIQIIRETFWADFRPPSLPMCNLFNLVTLSRPKKMSRIFEWSLKP